MAYTIAWNAATPVGSSTNANTIDDELRNLKTSIQERMNNVLENAWETDGNDPKTLSVSAIAGTPRVARVYTLNVETAAAGVNTVIDFDAETFDTGSFHDNDANQSRLTCTVAAYYLIRCSIRWVSGATAAIATIQIRKNGSTVVAQVQHRHNAGTSSEQFTIQTIVLAAANDYFEYLMNQSSGNTWTASTNEVDAYFEIMQLAGLT